MVVTLLLSVVEDNNGLWETMHNEGQESLQAQKGRDLVWNRGSVLILEEQGRANKSPCNLCPLLTKESLSD